ncbi:UNVERIFIED_CONTAM: Vacuolar protein sorting-associated protein 35B [Sesamum radiatum]|uniref:Vacuolar protein sorting-associated protein 35B n=1 Tax=Sesamum radiatum TaxID=300843 RepID=A0AAW2PYF6_SESRA
MMISNGIEDEEKWLAEGIAGIQHNAFYLHRAVDSNNLREALKYSAQLLSELRTSKLSPHKYYELYMRAFDELRRLEMFFKDEDRHGCSIVDLYELVQHAGNVLPRLYLLCTVGSVYIKSKEAPAKDVLKDLVEMCRAVQNPIRGLFLRSYLAQVSRDKLPDIGSEYEGEGDTVMDAVEFVLQNFTEMNKLWVRMQHQIVNCKDELAQYYLMDCIIQVFPDEYHLQTLETLLGACPQLQVIEAQVDMPIVGAITLYVSLLSFTLRVHPDRLDYVDQVLLDEEDFNEEQNSVACLMHILYNDDPEDMLKLVRRLQGQDGDVAGEEVPATPRKIFQLLNQIIESLSVVPAPELALRLYLQCAEGANDCDLEPVAYDFFTQAFVLYEEEIADSKAQVTAIHLIIGTLQRMNVFGVENRDTLTHKATGYSAKLLKKPDQCRAVYACSHLFWVDDQDGIKDGERVLLCLKRSLRIANAAQQMANVTRGSSGPVTLFVEILNKYLYYFEKGNPQITASVIQGLVDLIKTEMQSDSATGGPASDAFFTSTLRYIQFQKQKGGTMGII